MTNLTRKTAQQKRIETLKSGLYEKRKLTLRFDEELLRKFKTKTSAEGVTMSSVIGVFINQYLMK